MNAILCLQLVQYQEQSDLAFQLLIKSQLMQRPLDLEVLMSYAPTPVPASLGTPDGFFNNTNKAASMHFLMEDIIDEDSQLPRWCCLDSRWKRPFPCSFGLTTYVWWDLFEDPWPHGCSHIIHLQHKQLLANFYQIIALQLINSSSVVLLLCDHLTSVCFSEMKTTSANLQNWCWRFEANHRQPQDLQSAMRQCSLWRDEPIIWPHLKER